MPAPNAINPKTGKRYAWEEEQRRLKEQSTEHLEAQLALYQRQQKVLQARDDLMAFTRFVAPHPEDPNDTERSAYEPARFHRIIAKHLEQVERGDIRQLIFCMPPRHGKTRLATESLAAWYAGRHPEHDVAVAMATDLLATDVGANVRNTLASPQFRQVFPAFRLVKGGQAKDNIQTTQRGRLVFVGRGGTLNGRGASLLLVDDLYKDDKEAASQTIRDDAWNWFTRVALMRRMHKKLVVLTMTRWHEDDIIGRLTDPNNPYYDEREAKSWKIIRLPGIAEDDDDPLGRKPGEALWPERYDAEYLLATQRRDPLGFAALIQQRPTVADGVLFQRENIRYYGPDELPESLRIYCASDHAVATGQRNDYTVLLKVGVDRNNDIYVLDCYRQKATSDKAVEAMLAMASGKDRPLLWWAERGHISKSIGPFLRKRMLETGIFINIREMTPTGDKEQRAQSIAARVAMGKVLFPRNAVWTERAVDEMMAFPNGTHDDFVDALAYIGLGLGSQFAPSAKRGIQNKQRPEFGTLGWVKMHDNWAKEQREIKAAGGF